MSIILCLCAYAILNFLDLRNIFLMENPTQLNNHAAHSLSLYSQRVLHILRSKKKTESIGQRANIVHIHFNGVVCVCLCVTHSQQQSTTMPKPWSTTFMRFFHFFSFHSFERVEFSFSASQPTNRCRLRRH